MYRDKVVFWTCFVAFFALLIGLVVWMTKGRVEDILITGLCLEAGKLWGREELMAEISRKGEN